MKIFKKTIILVLILAVLCTVLYYVYPNFTEEKEIDEYLKLVDLTSDDIQKFNILGGEYDYYFSRDNNDSWIMTSPKAEVSSTAIDTVALEVCSIYAKKVIKEDVKDKQLADYGLDNPIVVNAVTVDKKEYSYEIGNLEPNKQGYYFKEKGKNKIYLMENYKANTLLTDFKKLGNTTLISCNQDNITAFKLVKDSKPVYEVINNKNVGWEIVSPIKCTAREYVVNELLPNLSNISVNEIFAISSNDKKFGFDKPSYELSVTDKESGTQTMLLGKQRTTGVFYAKVKGKQNIMLINAIQMPFIDKPLKDIMDNFAYLQDITKLTNVQVKYKNFKDNIDIAYAKTEDGEKEKEEFSFNGHDVTFLRTDNAKLMIKEYYQSFVSVVWYEVDFDIKPKYSNPILAIKYTTEDDEIVIVEYVRKNDNYSYCFINGKFTGLTIDNDQFKEIEKNRKVLNDEVKRRTE